MRPVGDSMTTSDTTDWQEIESQYYMQTVRRALGELLAAENEAAQTATPESARSRRG